MRLRQRRTSMKNQSSHELTYYYGMKQKYAANGGS
jgi:hypothetical protein